MIDQDEQTARHLYHIDAVFGGKQSNWDGLSEEEKNVWRAKAGNKVTVSLANHLPGQVIHISMPPQEVKE